MQVVLYLKQLLSKISELYPDQIKIYLELNFVVRLKHHLYSWTSDAGRSEQACPFCHRMFQRGASLRDHIKYCQEREGGHMVCPLCGYTATLRAQMERHLALHNQMQDKVRYTAGATSISARRHIVITLIYDLEVVALKSFICNFVYTSSHPAICPIN